MIKKIFRFFWALIKKMIFFSLLLVVCLFIISSALFYFSLPLIEQKTKERFGDGFFYVYDQSKGEYGHRRTDPVCVPSFKDIPKDILFERVVLHHMLLTNWGSKKSFPNRYTYRVPIYFGVIDKDNKFYYWSYWNFDYVYNPEALISRRFLSMMYDEIEDCRAITQTTAAVPEKDAK